MSENNEVDNKNYKLYKFTTDYITESNYNQVYVVEAEKKNAKFCYFTKIFCNTEKCVVYTSENMNCYRSIYHLLKLKF